MGEGGAECVAFGALFKLGVGANLKGFFFVKAQVANSRDEAGAEQGQSDPGIGGRGQGNS